jgi:hypothetical protein
MSGSITFNPASGLQTEIIGQTYTPLQPGVSVAFGGTTDPAPYTATVTFDPNDFTVTAADGSVVTDGQYTVANANLGAAVSAVADLKFTPIRADRTAISYTLSDANASAAFTDAITISSPLCFLRGSQIATPTGEVPVERLVVGDAVLTLRGEARPIVWIGKGQVVTTPGHRTAATPVIVRKAALAENVPSRDLHITKAHGLHFDGVLIPVEFLVNHRSILWDDRAKVETLYHIELETHDILIANGAPAETYRDDGNRWLFDNADEGRYLPPQLPCAPVLTGGPIVDAVWRRLLNRSGPRPGLPLTDDPDVHLMINGQRIDAVARRDKQYFFRLPRGSGDIRLLSREAVPTELGLARDPRSLGVAVKQIRISRGKKLALIEAANDLLVRGFHDYESDNCLRWTNGNAELPASLTSGFSEEAELMLQLAGTTCYPLLAEKADTLRPRAATYP